MTIFNNFRKISGLKVNFDKTHIVPLGPIKNNYRILLPETNIKWTTEPIKTLGINLSANLKNILDINYGPVKDKIINILNIWSQRNLTLYGKTTVIKSHVVSQLVYLMSVLPSPGVDYLKEIQSKMFKFLWNNKPEKIRRRILYLDKNAGGLKFPNMEVQEKCLKIAWVKRFHENINLSIFVHSQFGEIGPLFWECNLNVKDLHMVFPPKSNNIFLKEIINAWCQYKYHIAERKDTLL